MNVLIIEDEYPAAERLTKLIRKLDARIAILGVLESVESARRWFTTEPPVDLIFADIQLSDGLSFQIFEDFPAHSPIVFTTSYDEYAIRAFRVKSIDYLLKPIKLPELAAALQKYESLKKDFLPQAYAAKIESLLDSLPFARQPFKTRFLIKNQEHLLTVTQEQIAYFFTTNELTCLVEHDGRQFLVEHTLEELENRLDPAQFFRLNRQLIVHITTIQKIHPHFNGKLKIELLPAITQEAFVSREKAAAFKAWLNGDTEGFR